MAATKETAPFCSTHLHPAARHEHAAWDFEGAAAAAATATHLLEVVAAAALARYHTAIKRCSTDSLGSRVEGVTKSRRGSAHRKATKHLVASRVEAELSAMLKVKVDDKELGSRVSDGWTKTCEPRARARLHEWESEGWCDAVLKSCTSSAGVRLRWVVSR